LKALILAAGTASRLRPLTNSLPKCMLEVGGITIIERTINNLVAGGVSDIIIVTGYLADELKEFIQSKFPGLQIAYIHNPVYDSTNNIYSLWLARDLVKDSEILLLDSDIIFDKKILDLLLTSEYENCLALRSSGEIGVEEMKITTDTQSKVVEIAKTIALEMAAGESVGIEKFSQSFVSELYKILETLIIDQNQADKFYELAFQLAIDSGQELYACNVGNLRCIEVDTPDDMRLANELAKDLSH
jgi:choline kinase